ncbi:uncharacterized protein N7518_008957 [Penicillium psychrosexuale]|uniref:uncharacterized protein n=1 Tax=Penicillium psychrosexuale TaxID=1002107 RepID=UPI0025458752|nr:uncharacterized protein N7518_008957 [Penicillium psychrosexuale]KAJ5791946.1 hypothetical protein N7518_008957 [Penicillium psychrosexuale]
MAGFMDLFPQLASRDFEKAGICCTTDIPTGDFIFDFPLEHKPLFIATGGNAHAFKFLPAIREYIVGSFQLRLSRELLDKWKFPTQSRGRFQEEVFTGDGSRGGPERRELTTQKLNTFDTALKAASPRPGKICSCEGHNPGNISCYKEEQLPIFGAITYFERIRAR